MKSTGYTVEGMIEQIRKWETPGYRYQYVIRAKIDKKTGARVFNVDLELYPVKRKRRTL